MNIKTPLPLSLFDAVGALSALCDKIDDAEELDKALIEEFSQADRTLAESVDRRKYVYQEAEFRIKLAKSRKEELDAAIKRLTRVQQEIEKSTRSLIEANPGIPFHDTVGNKLSIRRNPAKLKLCFDVKDAKNFSNLVDEKAIGLLGIDSKYLEKVSFFTLRTDLIRDDLREGVNLPWAEFEYGSHVRGLK